MTPSNTNSPKTCLASPSLERAAPAHREGGPAGSVVPFVTGAPRRFRRGADDAPRGRILLFTGVRYERLPEAETAPVPKRCRS
ncbi:MAG: hypothetical protein PGN25_10500 [Methylorubrum populi]